MSRPSVNLSTWILGSLACVWFGIPCAAISQPQSTGEYGVAEAQFEAAIRAFEGRHSSEKIGERFGMCDDLLSPTKDQKIYMVHATDDALHVSMELEEAYHPKKGEWQYLVIARHQSGAAIELWSTLEGNMKCRIRLSSWQPNPYEVGLRFNNPSKLVMFGKRIDGKVSIEGNASTVFKAMNQDILRFDDAAPASYLKTAGGGSTGDPPALRIEMKDPDDFVRFSRTKIGPGSEEDHCGIEEFCVDKEGHMKAEFECHGISVSCSTEGKIALSAGNKHIKVEVSP